MAIDDNTSYELTGYQIKDLAGRIRRKAEASSVPTSISDLGQVTASDIDWSTMPGSYSTTEQATPFTWIDGKPIYKKTIDFGALPNSTSRTVQHGISNLGQLVKFDGIATSSDGIRRPLQIPPTGNTSSWAVLIEINAQNVSAWTYRDWSSSTAYVTLWYTKTS